MFRFVFTSFVFLCFISNCVCVPVIFDCFLNKGTAKEIKLGFSFHNFFVADVSQRTFDLKVYKVHQIHESVKGNNITPEHISLCEVTFYGDGMNILHYLEDGETKYHFLGNYVSRKFRAFNIKVRLLDPTEKYHKTSDVPVEDLLNHSLYYQGKLPYFTFDMGKQTKTAECELKVLDIQKQIASVTSAKLTNQSPNTAPVSVRGVQTQTQDQLVPPNQTNQSHFLVL